MRLADTSMVLLEGRLIVDTAEIGIAVDRLRASGLTIQDVTRDAHNQDLWFVRFTMHVELKEP